MAQPMELFGLYPQCVIKSYCLEVRLEGIYTMIETSCAELS